MEWRGCWDWLRDPRGRTAGEFTDLLGKISDLSLSSSDDKWVWNLDPSGGFSVSSLTHMVQHKLNAELFSNIQYIWNSWVPRKVNICWWRMLLNRILTHEKLASRGRVLPSLQCLFCDNSLESLDHYLLSCW